jgi:polyferredoxin
MPYLEYQREYQKKARKEKPDVFKSYKLKKLGITLSEYKKLEKDQDNKCAICKKPETARKKGGFTKKLAVDHCHKSKKIRGLLCMNCNIAIGKFKDSVVLMQFAIEYLKSQEI